MVPVAELVSSQDKHVAILGEIAAELIHEVRNPLAAIQGHLEMWQRQCADGKVPDPGGFPIVIEEVAGINRLLNNFLAFSKCARRSTLVCDVAEIARHAVSLLEPEAAKWGVRVELAVAKTPSVKANPYFLARVFINLIRNAFAATGANGALTIKVGERPFTPAGLAVGGGLQPGVTAAMVEFQDNGQGFAATIAGAAASTGQGSGPEQSGIGLAFCREVLRGYGGSLEIISSAGGSCVTVALPAVRDWPVAGPPALEVVSHAGTARANELHGWRPAW